jgi:ligand-binding sensor domain-containing protein
VPASAGLPAGTWTSIVRDSGGTLWVRNAKHVFAMPSGASRFEDRTPAASMLRKVRLRTVLREDADGAMLINADPGLLRWSGPKGWVEIGRSNGLEAGGGVSDVLFDRERNAWLGTRGMGLVQLLGYGTWENWRRTQNLPDNVVLSFLRDGAGRMHVGSRSGHAQLQPGAVKFDVVPKPEALEGHQWATMALDQSGRVWAGTYSGLLLRYAPASGHTELMSKLPLVRMILPDRAGGRMWIATSAGLRVLPENAPPGSVPETVSYPAAPIQPPSALHLTAISTLAASTAPDPCG